MNLIRTRYAPSPTGNLHIGGARTALFNFLYAKKMNGQFIVRIEDTDISRNVKDGAKLQLDNLRWLGIIADESIETPNHKYGPYAQSEKLNKYKELINKLLLENKAYEAFDTIKELEKQKDEQMLRGIQSFKYDPSWLKISSDEISLRKQKNEFVIRFKVINEITYKWMDIVRGEIEFSGKEVEDFITQTQNGYTTYNFAVVVDDHDMQISHVLRGEEHITNTPKQLALYKAFNWESPEFGHLTIITNMAGKKLSKRDNSVPQFISDYKKTGYHPQGIVNFISLLGWTSKSKKEVFDLNELINDFSLERLSKAPAKFTIERLNWFSKTHFKQMPNNELKAFLPNSNKNDEWLDIFVSAFKKNLISTSDLIKDFLKYTNPMNCVNNEINSSVVKLFITKIQKREFSIESIQDIIAQIKSELNVGGKELFMPIRLATTCENHGQELAKAIFLFGQETIFKRLGIS